MNFTFYKYQATGNDFILLDNRDLSFPANEKNINFLCHRKFGIGSDGLILIQDTQEEGLDFEMIFHNPDGSQSMCGNGTRCAVKFTEFLRIIGEETRFRSTDGIHSATIKGDIVKLDMHDVTEVKSIEDDMFINTGSPHHIKFVNSVEDTDVVEEGRRIRHSQAYAPSGTNVNFVQLTEDNSIFVRTYERGVENETLSCGTGVTAACLASSAKDLQSPIRVKTLGGDLSVSFEKNGTDRFSNISLIGPAKQVYKGIIDLS